MGAIQVTPGFVEENLMEKILACIESLSEYESNKITYLLLEEKTET
jgi:hypothetical protein